jgi:hypothetical protein
MEHILNWLSDRLDGVKPLIITVMAWIVSVLSPVSNSLWLLIISFLINIAVGIITAVNAKGEKFSMSKFWDAFRQLVLYIVTVVFIYWTGNLLKDETFTETGVKWVTYIVVYCFFLNIFKNAHILWPKAKAIEIIYLLLSTEVFQRLKDFLGLKK